MEDFGPYVGETRIDFPDEGVVLVHGENGCGKTTIINAMNWCLYGTVLDRMGLEIDPLDLFNTDALEDGAPRFSVHSARRNEASAGAIGTSFGSAPST